jgi:3-phosphoshikimate 1-carboxyvinyltransferase
MGHYCVKKSMLKGELTIPPSKSHTLRALLFGALGSGKTVVYNLLPSPDAQAMIEACRLLGASINIFQDRVEIEGLNGTIAHAEDVINAGNSGIVLRMISAIAALSSSPIVITGDYSIRHLRPMHALNDGLRQLGVEVTSTRGDGFAPLIIQGPLRPGKAWVDGEDSQPVSALLIASIFASGPIEIHVKNPGEKPWIGMTLDWLKRLGVAFAHRDYAWYRVEGRGGFSGFSYHVPGDWSSAAFPMAAALITDSALTLHNLDFEDCQGDKAVVEVFQKMGARIEIDPKSKRLNLAKGSKLKGVDVDINHCIDAITILATVACFAEGETRLRNAAIARQKECNRIACIAKELSKMGADIVEHEDGLTIRRSFLRGATVESHHDHRMAMSLALAGMGAEGATQVRSVECVSKTFPSFADDFRRLGALLEVEVEG